MGSWRGVGLVTGWQLTASGCFYATFAATAFVRESFGVSRTATGLAVTATMLGYTALLFGTGAAVDAYGERPVMVGGLAATVVAALGVAAAPTFPALLIALVAVGFAYATAMPSTNRAALVVAPEGCRGLAMNVKQVGVTVGSAGAALVVGSAAASRFGWRAGFLVVAAVAAVVTVAFGAAYDGREGTGTLSTPDVRSLFDDGAYRGLTAAGLFLGAVVFTTTGYVVLHVSEDVGLAAGVAGAVLATVQITGSVGRLAGGAVADRLPWAPARSAGVVLTAQAFLTAVCLVAVATAERRLPVWVAYAALGLFVLGFPGVYYACMTALVPDDRVGAATAGGQTALNVGGLAAPPAFGFLADTVGYDVGWTALAGLAVVAGLLVGLRVVRPRGTAT